MMRKLIIALAAALAVAGATPAPLLSVTPAYAMDVRAGGL